MRVRVGVVRGRLAVEVEGGCRDEPAVRRACAARRSSPAGVVAGGPSGVGAADAGPTATARRSSAVAPGPVRTVMRADPPSTSQAPPAPPVLPAPSALPAPGATPAVTDRSASSPAPASAARIPRAPPARDVRTAADASGPPVYSAVVSPAPRPSSTTVSESRSDSSASQQTDPSRGATRRSA